MSLWITARGPAAEATSAPGPCAAVCGKPYILKQNPDATKKCHGVPKKGLRRALAIRK